MLPFFFLSKDLKLVCVLTGKVPLLALNKKAMKVWKMVDCTFSIQPYKQTHTKRDLP